MNSLALLSTANRDAGSLVRDLGPYHYLHTILEETPNGVIVVGHDHLVIHANPAASRFLGVSYGKIDGEGLRTLLGEDNGDFFLLIRDHFEQRGKANGEKLRHEIEFIRNGERTILSGVVVFPPADTSYYLVYLIDITQQKNLEGELRRRNAFFHNLIDSSVDSIIASDMKGRIMLFNQEAQSLLGYNNEDIKSLHVTQLYNEGVAYELIKRMRSSHFGGNGKLLRHKLNVKHKDGHDIPVSFSGGIIYDRGQEIATFGLFTDLRAMQQIEEDLEQSHRMLLQSEKMAGLGRLAAGVAHEINNPMSGIMLYANLVQEELGADHPLASDLQTIIHEAERCKVIVADLLEFSHQTTYEMEPVNLNEVIVKTLTILQHQPLFQNVQIIRELSPDLPPIYGNAIRLNQVVMNIVVNAAQAMDGKGRLHITSRTRANQDINEITIQDSGPGIDSGLLEKIFDPFFTTKAAGEGTGLGLSVSYAIVKEHKGSIRVTSSPETGTTFTLRFPVVMETLTGENHGE
ncbi:PAS domain S-box protein [Desulfopila sp. IMCC35006]|uniref:ATP-binding protein n=1 Tax=Desulfopila sp. IMCC35006 TaxID=2569542 RepID=UPI0010ABD678|nr:ATP-binding protein [Desulfopila sp. IMCC35006]TKB26907.1 PAS domain S-box protein [Desulfopila sp. IMCC35006]